MGGSQAGVPADDEMSPGHVPPGVATVPLEGRGAGRPEFRSRSGLRPGCGPQGQQGGAGAKQREAAEGPNNSAKEGNGCIHCREREEEPMPGIHHIRLKRNHQS
jgi:hypothetical protein